MPDVSDLISPGVMHGLPWSVIETLDLQIPRLVDYCTFGEDGGEAEVRCIVAEVRCIVYKDNSCYLCAVGPRRKMAVFIGGAGGVLRQIRD